MKKAITILFIGVILMFCSTATKAEVFTEEQKKTWTQDFDDTAKFLEDKAKESNSSFNNYFFTKHWRVFEFLFMLFVLGTPALAVTTTFLTKTGAYDSTSVTSVPVGAAVPGVVSLFLILLYYVCLRAVGFGIVFSFCGFYVAMFFDFMSYMTKSMF